MATFDVGEKFVSRSGQEYEFLGYVEHTKPDGGVVTLMEWRSQCADCGDPFLVKTTGADGRTAFNRRCDRHKAPGRRVR